MYDKRQTKLVLKLPATILRLLKNELAVKKNLRQTKPKEAEKILFAQYKLSNTPLKKAMSGEKIQQPGKRLLRSNSILVGSANPLNEVKIPAKRPKHTADRIGVKNVRAKETSLVAKKTSSQKPPKENVIPAECSLSCGLIGSMKELVAQVTKQANELVLAKDQLAQLQNKYIKVLENQYVQAENAKKRQREMEHEILSLQTEMKKNPADKFVKDLIDFDGAAEENIGNRKLFISKLYLINAISFTY